MQAIDLMMGKSIKQKLTTVSFLIKITNIPGSGCTLMLCRNLRAALSGGGGLGKWIELRKS
jgi:hypothetical protein